MSKNLKYFSIALPRCRHCSRPWTPDDGVSAQHSYCPLCVASRRAIATEALELKPLALTDTTHGYFLPRSLRPR